MGPCHLFVVAVDGIFGAGNLIGHLRHANRASMEFSDRIGLVARGILYKEIERRGEKIGNLVTHLLSLPPVYSLPPPPDNRLRYHSHFLPPLLPRKFVLGPEEKAIRLFLSPPPPPAAA